MIITQERHNKTLVAGTNLALGTRQRSVFSIQWTVVGNRPSARRVFVWGKIGGMTILPESLIEVRSHDAPDYKPLIDYQSWRVALMNYTADLTPDKIIRMQKHTETDEVFVLLAGRCILFLGEGEDAVTSVHAVDMEPNKLYNVKRGAWHSHTFSEDAKVLIVENRDTVEENSPFVGLSAEQQNQVVKMTKTLWG